MGKSNQIIPKSSKCYMRCRWNSVTFILNQSRFHEYAYSKTAFPLRNKKTKTIKLQTIKTNVYGNALFTQYTNSRIQNNQSMLPEPFAS